MGSAIFQYCQTLVTKLSAHGHLKDIQNQSKTEYSRSAEKDEKQSFRTVKE
jgi:hypothetical protein